MVDSEAVVNKKCTKCGLTKAVSDFYERSDRPGFRTAHCIECKKNRHKEKMGDPAYRQEKQNRSEQWKKENWLHARFLMAKANAISNKRRSGKEFSLTLEECKEIWKQGCHYCKCPILEHTGVGLDRRDNSRGYMLDNVLPCCGSCNKVRNTVLTVEEMEVAMNAVIDFRKKQMEFCMAQFNVKVAETPDSSDYVRRMCLLPKGHAGDHSMGNSK